MKLGTLSLLGILTATTLVAVACKNGDGEVKGDGDGDQPGGGSSGSSSGDGDGDTVGTSIGGSGLGGQGGSPNIPVDPVTVYAYRQGAGKLISVANAAGKHLATYETDSEGKVVVQDFPPGGSVSYLYGVADDYAEVYSVLSVQPGDILAPARRASPATSDVGHLQYTFDTALGASDFNYVLNTCAGSTYDYSLPATATATISDGCLDAGGNYAWLATVNDDQGLLLGYEFQKAVSPIPDPTIISTSSWQTQVVDVELGFNNDGVGTRTVNAAASSNYGVVSHRPDRKTFEVLESAIGTALFTHPADFPDEFMFSWGVGNESLFQFVGGPLAGGMTHSFNAQASDLLGALSPSHSFDGDQLTLSVDVDKTCWETIVPNRVELFVYGESPTRYIEWNIIAPPQAELVLPELPSEFPAGTWDPASFTEDFYVEIELAGLSGVTDPTERTAGVPAFVRRSTLDGVGKTCRSEVTLDLN